MPNTSVHLPPSLLAGLDRIAAERGISRNRLIVESCQRAVEERTCWPSGLFSNDHLSEAQLQSLRRSESEFQSAVEDARKSRALSPF